jgi:hypothetical protein
MYSPDHVTYVVPEVSAQEISGTLAVFKGLKLHFLFWIGKHVDAIVFIPL